MTLIEKLEAREDLLCDKAVAEIRRLQDAIDKELAPKREREARFSEAVYVLYKRGTRISNELRVRINDMVQKDLPIKQVFHSKHGARWVVDYD